MVILFLVPLSIIFLIQEAAKDLAKKASVYLGDFADDWPVLIDIFGNKIYSSVVTAAGVR